MLTTTTNIPYLFSSLVYTYVQSKSNMPPWGLSSPVGTIVPGGIKRPIQASNYTENKFEEKDSPPPPPS